MAEAPQQGVYPVLDSFTMKVWVTTRHTFPQTVTYLETAYFEDSDVRSMNVTWRASYQFEGSTLLTSTCFGTASLNGSGSGTGRFWKADTPYPGDYGLPTNQRWTMLIAFGSGVRVRGQVAGCGRDAVIDREQDTEPAHVFLPGTVAELAALPVGTQINREYSKKDSSRRTTTWRYEAVKHAVPPPPVPENENRLVVRIKPGDNGLRGISMTKTKLKAGEVWKIEVSDTTPQHNIRVVGAGVNRRTSVPGKSHHVWTVTLKRGKLTLYSERAPTRRFTLIVS